MPWRFREGSLLISRTVSSLATAPEGAAPGPPETAHDSRAVASRPGADAAFGLVLAAGLTLLAFITRGGTDLGTDGLGQNTWAEIILVLIGAGLAVAVVVAGARGRLWGGGTLLAFAAVTALSAISIAWSVQPANSWQTADQAFAYLLAFGGALALARLVPARWPGLVGAIALLAAVVCGWALLVKVFPATLDPGELYGRLRAPFDYWNATGLMAAMGLPACVWAGARRERGRVTGALATPAISVLLAVLILSYSRGAVAATVIGMALWFAVVPLRLRGALVLAVGAAGGAAISLWALTTHALTHDYVALAPRTAAGHTFGVVLLVVLALTTIAGFATTYAIDRVTLPAELQRRIGTGLVVLVALVPLAAIGGLAASSRGLTGEVSHLWSTLTSTNAVVKNNSSRLTNLGNSRSRYWSEAITVGKHNALEGVGAAGFGIARTRYSTDSEQVDNAHGYVVETFADLGLIGLALNLGLLVAWFIAAGRSVGARARFRAPPGHEAEQAGLLTLLVIVIIFGIHSAIDWTWFIPGTAVPALVCAGWLAGRGPVTEPVGRISQRRRLTSRPAAGAAIVAIVGLAIVGAWAIWQPLRSADADAGAITALAHGDTQAATADARAAVARNPLAAEPLWELGEIYLGAGDRDGARTEFVRAVSLQPQNPQTWFHLGDYELQVNDGRGAVGPLQRARQLDRTDPTIQTELAQALRSR